jgi:hypothetical protein
MYRNSKEDTSSAVSSEDLHGLPFDGTLSWTLKPRNPKTLSLREPRIDVAFQYLSTMTYLNVRATTLICTPRLFTRKCVSREEIYDCKVPALSRLDFIKLPSIVSVPILSLYFINGRCPEQISCFLREQIFLTFFAITRTTLQYNPILHAGLFVCSFAWR